jgi:hypothetical protein
MAEGKPIFAALMAVQAELKAPKNQHNSFGKYDYRSAEDIIEAVKPLLKENGLFINMSDEVVLVGDRYYIKATVKVVDAVTGESVQTSAFARESAQKKGMDESQVTGTASSYARKYALNGLFAIDDNRDADTDEYARQTRPAAAARPARPPIAEDRQKLWKDLSEAIKRTGTTGEELSAICGKKFGKTQSRTLTTSEVKTLIAHLEEWAAESMAGGD